MSLFRESIGLKTLRDFALGSLPIDPAVRSLSTWFDAHIREIYRTSEGRTANSVEIYPKSNDIQGVLAMPNSFNTLPKMRAKEETQLVEAEIGRLLSSPESTVNQTQVTSEKEFITRSIIDISIADNLAQLYEKASSDIEAAKILQLAVNMAHKFDLFILANQLKFIENDPDCASKVFNNLKPYFLISDRNQDTLLAYTQLLQWFFRKAPLPLMLEKFLDVNSLLDSKALPMDAKKYLKKLADVFSCNIVEAAKNFSVSKNPFCYDPLFEKLVEPQLNSKTKNFLVKLLLRINDPYMPLILSKFISDDETLDRDKRFLFVCLGALAKSENEVIADSALDQLESYARIDSDQAPQLKSYALKALSMSESGCSNIFQGVRSEEYSMSLSIKALTYSNTDGALKNLFYILENMSDDRPKSRIFKELKTFLKPQRKRLEAILTREFLKPAYGSSEPQLAKELTTGLLKNLGI